MTDKSRLKQALNRAEIIRIVIAGLSSPGRKSLSHHQPNRRVLRVERQGPYEVSFHATKGWRVQRVAA